MTFEATMHLIHKWRNARKSLGRVHENEGKGASIQMKTKQSMEMQVLSLVILEIDWASSCRCPFHRICMVVGRHNLQINDAQVTEPIEPSELGQAVALLLPLSVSK